MLRHALIRRSPLGPAAARISFPDFLGRAFGDLTTPISLTDSFAGCPDCSGSWAPPVDFRETDEEFVAEVELPGIDKRDLKVTVEKNVLTVSGERTRETEENEPGYRRIERRQGKFLRSFALPGRVDSDNVHAALKDGVLTVTIPKAEAAKTRQIEIH